MARGPKATVVNRIPLIENQFRHDLAGLGRALLAREEIVDVHGAGIYVFEVGAALRKERAGIGTVHPRVRADEMRPVIRSFQELRVAEADVHLVPGGGAVEEPMVEDRAIDILKGT